MKSLFLLSIALLVCGICAQQCFKHHNNCGLCSEIDGCGFCGVFVEEGYCIKGSASDSGECPMEYWKYEKSECSNPLRIVEIDDSNPEKVTFGSVGIYGQTEEEALIDSLYMELNTELDDDNNRAARFLLGYGTGDVENIDYSLFGVTFNQIIEYEDTDNSGFDCVDTSSLANCPSFLEIRQIYNISDFKPITWSQEDLDGEQKIFRGVIETADDVFKAECVGSNDDFTYEGRKLSPYEWKCDVYITGFPYLDDQANSLTLQTVVASLTVTDNLDDSTDIDPDDCETCMLDFVDGGRFSWAPKATNGADGDAEIVVERSQVHLVNYVPDWDPEAEVYITFFSFKEIGANDIVWDPTVAYVNKRQILDIDSSSAAGLEKWL